MTNKKLQIANAVGNENLLNDIREHEDRNIFEVDIGFGTEIKTHKLDMAVTRVESKNGFTTVVLKQV